MNRSLVASLALALAPGATVVPAVLAADRGVTESAAIARTATANSAALSALFTLLAAVSVLALIAGRLPDVRRR